jgi:hypothetical protein
VYTRSLNPSVLEFNLSLHRHQFICILCSYCYTSFFIYNKRIRAASVGSVCRLSVEGNDGTEDWGVSLMVQCPSLEYVYLYGNQIVSGFYLGGLLLKVKKYPSDLIQD